MTHMETAMAILMKTFDTYAASDGNKDSLSKGEVKTLLEKELPALLKVPYGPWGGKTVVTTPRPAQWGSGTYARTFNIYSLNLVFAV